MKAPVPAVELVAHRGAGTDFPPGGAPPGRASHPAAPPENTLPALAWGWAEVEACELDVRLTADDRVVVLHDATTARTCDRDLEVAATPLAELRALDAGIRKGAAWRGLRLPTLGEALAARPAGKRLYVDLKGGPVLARAVLAEIEASGAPPDKLALLSFDLETLLFAAERRSDLATYWNLAFDLVGKGRWRMGVDRSEADGRGSRHAWVPLDVASLASDAHPARRLSGLNLGQPSPPGLVETLVAAGVAVGAWTVDDAGSALALARAGAFQITSNAVGDVRGALAQARPAQTSVVSAAVNLSFNR